jgi:predicted metal-binding membrane protein
MRNIFELTKREQRIVIAVVMALVVFTFAKHLLQKQPEPVPSTTTSTPAASPTLPPSKDESESDDQR